MSEFVRLTPFGSVPSHWHIARVGDLGLVQVGRARSPGTDIGSNMVPYLRVANVLDGYIDYSDVNRMHFSPAEQRKYTLRAGDILLNEGQSTELVGRSALYDGPEDRYCFQNSLVNFRSGPSVHPPFARAVFKRWLDIGHFTKILKQTTSMAHLGGERFANLEFPVPPLVEQHRIAAVLDTIDDSIRSTEQIIAKLVQLKQGLLHDLLTRGIDDNGELRDPVRHSEQFKDSPVGRIPSGWDVVVFGSLLEGIEAGKSPDCPDRPASGAEWGVLKVSAVRPAGFQANENKAITKDALVETAYEVRDGDLLITRANTYELVGLTCLVQAPPPRLLLCDKTLRLNTKATADRRFIFHTLQMPHVRAQIETHATGSSGSMKNIGQKAIKALRFLLPSHAEQVAIAQILEAHHQRVDTETRELTKLRLLKQGLTEDLLTGRVRVTPLLEGTPP